MSLFLTKVWGFREPAGPLPFNAPGNRKRALEMLATGDRVLYVATKGDEVEPQYHGKLLAMVEPTRTTANTLDYPVVSRAIDYNDAGEFRWPFALTLNRAWRFDPEVPLEQVISRSFSMDAVTSIVPLTTEEEAAILALSHHEIPVLQPHLAKLNQLARDDLARSKSSPGVALVRKGLMTLRDAPAFTYCMTIERAERRDSARRIGSTRNDHDILGFKIGWAFDPKRRRHDFNHAALPSLGGLRYEIFRTEQWRTTRDAWAMEQAILRRFDVNRSRHNHEVLAGITIRQIEAAWTVALIDQRRRPGRD